MDCARRLQGCCRLLGLGAAFAFLFLGMAGVGTATAQKAPVKLTCTFDRQVDPESGAVSSAKNFSFEYTVDTVTGKAYMTGNNGVSEVHLVTGSEGMTFLEVLPTGAVQSTTVHHDTGDAVHSRHTMMSLTNELFPSQNYGTCE